MPLVSQFNFLKSDKYKESENIQNAIICSSANFGNDITNVSLKLKHSRKKTTKKTKMVLKGTLTVLPILVTWEKHQR